MLFVLLLIFHVPQSSVIITKRLWLELHNGGRWQWVAGRAGNRENWELAELGTGRVGISELGTEKLAKLANGKWQLER